MMNLGSRMFIGGSGSGGGIRRSRSVFFRGDVFDRAAGVRGSDT